MSKLVVLFHIVMGFERSCGLLLFATGGTAVAELQLKCVFIFRIFTSPRENRHTCFYPAGFPWVESAGFPVISIPGQLSDSVC